MSSTKPVIFISYAHADEPDHPREDEVQWLSFVRRYLQPARKDGIVDLWVDRQYARRHRLGRRDRAESSYLRHFHSARLAHSMASDYIVDQEIATIEERQRKGDTSTFIRSC